MKSYVILSESWYAKACMSAMRPHGKLDDVMFGEYPDGGGCKWEACFELVKYGGHVCTKLSFHNDAFKFSEVAGVLKELEENGANTIKEFTEILDRNGFTDVTKRENKS